MLTLRDAAPAAGRLLPWSRRLSLGLLLLWSTAVRIWFAGGELNDTRYWDERYAVQNLRAAVVAGSLAPVNYYYQSLSYLPQAALLTAAERGIHLAGSPAYSFFDDSGLKPEGYLVCRWTVVLFALLSLWLTYRLGCRLASPEVGIVAALLLATSPLHIRLSTSFKPDMLVLTLTLLTLHWTFAAFEDPRWQCYLLAGAGVGLAMSAKLTGAASAVPLAVGALAAGCGERRHWLRLGGAGFAATAVFAALNPQLDRYRDAFVHNLDLYASRGEAAASGPSSFEEITHFPLPASFYGHRIELYAAAGFVVAFGVALWRWHQRRPGGLAGLAVASYPAGFVLIYGAFTSHTKANNFLPVAALLALGCAGLLIGIWHFAVRPLPVLVRGLAGAAAGLVLAAVTLSAAQRYAYIVLTPSTWQRALNLVDAELSPPARRLAFFEDPPALDYGDSWRPMYRTDEELARVDPAQLARSDAEVFPSARLLESSSFYRRRIAPRDGVRVRLVRPRLFFARGEKLVVVLHPAHEVLVRQVAAVTVAANAGAFVPLPVSLASTESLSVEIRLPHGSPPPRLRVAREEQNLRRFREGGQDLWESDRFRPSPAAAHVAQLLLGADVEPAAAEVWVSRWTHPEGPPAGGGP